MYTIFFRGQMLTMALQINKNIDLNESYCFQNYPKSTIISFHFIYLLTYLLLYLSRLHTGGA